MLKVTEMKYKLNDQKQLAKIYFEQLFVNVNLTLPPGRRLGAAEHTVLEHIVFSEDKKIDGRTFEVHAMMNLAWNTIRLALHKLEANEIVQHDGEFNYELTAKHAFNIKQILSSNQLTFFLTVDASKVAANA